LANSATAAGYNNYYHFPVVAFNASIQIALLALFTALSEAAYRRVPSIPAASPWRPERLVSNASPAWLLAVSALVVLALELRRSAAHRVGRTHLGMALGGVMRRPGAGLRAVEKAEDSR